MANRSKINDRSGGWKLTNRRKAGMKQTTLDRALGVPQADGTVVFDTRAGQRERQRPATPDHE